MSTRTRSTAGVLAPRTGATRRISRRATRRLYCATNGCASFLRLDAKTGVATCPICGYQRRPH